MASLASLVASPSDVLLGPLSAAEAASGGWPHDQQFYRELLQALPAAIYTTDAAGRITFYSAGRITFYNEPAVELAGRRPELGSDRWCVSWRLYWPDGTPMAHDECPMAVALREDRPIRGREIIAERPDGTRVTVLPYPTPLHDASGKLVGAVNMLVDISDRKRIENALRRLNVALTERVEEHAQQLEETAAKLDRTERDFRMLVHSVTDYAIYMLDPEGFITSWNAGAERIKGYREDEIIGQHFSRFYTEKDRASGLPERALATAAREGKYEAEAWRVSKNGERFWASVLIDPIRDDTGELVGFAKVTRDITERRQAQEALAESADLARGIIDTALDAFVQIDDTGTVLEWNAQAEAVFGWSQQEAIGKSLGTLILLPSERARHRKRLERLLRTGKGRILGRRLQLQALRRDGKEITVELSITALRCRDRYVFNGFIRDLTEKLAAEAERHHAQKMEAIGQLTGGVAHDFNNLLTAIVGHLEVLAARAPKRWSARRHVEAALRAAWRGSGLTEQLLSFSRRREIHPEVVSIERLLRTATLLCQKTVGEGVEVVVRVAEDLWASRIDPGQFEAALLNLSANARDAMDGRGCLTITAENVPNGAKEDVNLAAGQYVVVSVTDTGRGMGKDVLARAFEPFYTTKEAGKGTGLGLSQVYGFATQSGGIARIASRKGRGTTVRLYVPRAEGKVRYERSLGDLPPAADGTATVLIVEDDADVRGMITEVLSHLGYSTVVATAGPEALATLRRNRSIDVLMSDNVMPGGLSGIELARIARKLRPGLKVLLSSGYTGEETGADLALGEFSFVAKPYRPGELATKLKEVLASR